MRGDIPTDLSKIEAMVTIPQAERDKFKALTTPPQTINHATTHVTSHALTSSMKKTR